MVPAIEWTFGKQGPNRAEQFSGKKKMLKFVFKGVEMTHCMAA